MNTKNKRHLFLTGSIQAGKSTVIRRFLETAPLVPEQTGGFLTVAKMERDGSSTVHIVSPENSGDFRSENCIMTREPKIRENRGYPVLYPEVFDREGTGLLRNSSRKKLILMDELGFAERDAALFRQTVLNTLDGKIPVLGVLRQYDYDFLNQVASHPQVEVITVTEENRNRIAALLCFAWHINTGRQENED